MTLSIVIPAFNEEESIERIIRKALAARSYIIQNSDVDAVEITVVSDGSTDRTVELASKYVDEINLIVFKQNRGYGAAIKQGWKESKGELLGFLDADGTCDPHFFADLCNIITRENVDIALGSRLNKHSRMPFVRRIGNTIFSILLSFMASQKVKDTASGMRVVKKSSLDKIMPLPEGLHFTPAMSARAVLSKDLSIKEKDMVYREREGYSKLHAFKDGLRFLKIILQTALLYKPNIFLSIIGGAILTFGLALIAYPLYYYVVNKKLLEWMIYRIVLTNLAIIGATLFFSASYVTEKIVNITLFNNEESERHSMVARFFETNIAWFVACLFFIFGLWLILGSLTERIITGETHEHWSRYLAMATFYATSFIILVTKIINFFLNLIHERLRYLKSRKTHF